jgi:hypothetical protein
VIDPEMNLLEIIANLNAPPKTADELKNDSKSNYNSIIEVNQQSIIQEVTYPPTTRTVQELVQNFAEAQIPKLPFNFEAQLEAANAKIKQLVDKENDYKTIIKALFK